MTRYPGKYKKEEVPGMLEFTNNNPIEIIEGMSKLGYRDLLVLGGGLINSEFLKVNLIDELYLTVEPRLFGSGAPLLSASKSNNSLNLMECSQLNKQGTLLLHYKIQKES